MQYLTNLIYENIINYQICQKIISEGLEMKLTQNDPEMKDAFKQMNDNIYGDLSDKEKKDLTNKYTQSFKYKSREGNITNPTVDAQIKGEVFPFGNAKLTQDVLIINLTSAMHCPSRKFCPLPTSCYAWLDEIKYTNVRARNGRNEMMFDRVRENPAKWSYIFWFIKQYIEKARELGLQVHFLRLNESGDFKTAEEIKRFDEFAKEIKDKYGVITHCYTCNEALKDAISQIENMNVNASIGTITGKNVFRHFYGISEKRLETLEDTPLQDIATPLLKKDATYGLYYKCPCDIANGKKCINCQVCYNDKCGIDEEGNQQQYFSVLCKLHGQGAQNYDSTYAQKKRGFADDNEKVLPIKKQKENIKNKSKIANKNANIKENGTKS